MGAVIAPKLGSQSPPHASAWAHLSLIEDWDEEERASTRKDSDGDAITEKTPPPASGSASPKDAPVDIGKPGAAPGFASGPSAVKVFWISTLICTVLTMVLLTFWSVWNPFIGGRRGARRASDDMVEALATGLCFLILGFPVVQLASAFVTLLFLSAKSGSDSSFQLRRLGKITLGVIVGAVAGVLAMVIIGFVLSRR